MAEGIFCFILLTYYVLKSHFIVYIQYKPKHLQTWFVATKKEECQVIYLQQSKTKNIKTKRDIVTYRSSIIIEDQNLYLWSRIV